MSDQHEIAECAVDWLRQEPLRELPAKLFEKIRDPIRDAVIAALEVLLEELRHARLPRAGAN